MARGLSSLDAVFASEEGMATMLAMSMASTPARPIFRLVVRRSELGKFWALFDQTSLILDTHVSLLVTRDDLLPPGLIVIGKLMANDPPLIERVNFGSTN